MRLVFNGDDISGHGADGDGPFTLRGQYLSEDRFVILDKAYDRLLVCYRGEWDGQMIAGLSTITAEGFFDTGEFEIWPESDEEGLRIAQTQLATLDSPHNS